MPKLTRRDFAKLLALSLGAGVAANGLPQLAGAAGAAKPAPAGLDPTLPLHPLLQYGALVEPDKRVRVLVQKIKPEHDGRKLAADGEATHLEEFAFVKAHYLEVKQSKLPKLALHPHVLYISPDGPTQRHAAPPKATGISTDALKTSYPFTVRADKVWNGSTPVTGKGVTVAVVDSGITASQTDLYTSGTIFGINVNKKTTSGTQDNHGHGTHVAGIIKGKASNGTYIGIAPDAKLVSVKIADDTGAATTADLLRGLQWCYDNRNSQAIRVINVSMGAATPESYRTSPVCAAVEQLWLNGVVVVVAAGNRGTDADAVWYAPANDPYVITVGALDENQSKNYADDSLATFSGRGMTQDGFAKPDVVAPGRRIVSTMAVSSSTLPQQLPERVTDGKYIRLSGTSMAAPVVAGIVALLLQRVPSLTPNQVKWVLKANAMAYPGMPDGAKLVDAYMSLLGAQGTVQSANQGLTPNTGISGAANTVSWGSNGYWDQGYWDQGYWDQAYWDQGNNFD